MGDSFHLQRRGAVWYYRRRVPEELVRTLGKSVVQYSLKTTDKKQAKKLREHEDLRWTAQFDSMLVHNPASDPLRSGAAVQDSTDKALRLIANYIDRSERSFGEVLAKEGPGDAETQKDMQVELETKLRILRNPDDADAAEMISRTADRVLLRLGQSQSGVIDDQVYEIVRRALLELSRRKLARLRDDYGRSYFDEMFSPSRLSRTNFAELAQQFIALKAEDARVNSTSLKHLDRIRAVVQLIEEIVGSSTAVAEVDYDVCLNVRSTLARVPLNRNKLFPGRDINEILRAADGATTLSPVSQERYLSGLRDILDLALRKGLIDTNPAQGMRALKREQVASGDKRRPFKIDQLQQLFSDEFYMACAEHDLPFRGAPRPSRFWLPLVCLLAGMRPNEVCQLSAADVARTAKGIWYISIDTSGGAVEEGSAVKKTLKTASSKRRVPVHPILEAIGFLEFVRLRKEADSTGRLFPELAPNKYNNHAWYLLKQFNEVILPKSIVLEPRQSFYSLRHSWRDALRRAKATPDVLAAFGWSQGKLASDDYGDKYDPDTLSDFVSTISFPGLDLSHLHLK